MKRYHSSGGASDPGFRYNVPVKKVTDEMIAWCENYYLNSDFERYYVKWMFNIEDLHNSINAIFEFEVEEAAAMFILTWK